MVSYVEKIEGKTFKPAKPKKSGKPNKANKTNKPNKSNKPVKPAKSVAQDVDADQEQKKQEELAKIKEKTSPNFIKLKQYLPTMYEGLDVLDLSKPKITKQWVTFFKMHGPSAFARLLRDLNIIQNADVAPLVRFLTTKIHGV
jgi:hypothetical protein